METKEDTLSFERIVFFSDAVFAIAITLLAIDIHIPEMAAGALAAQMLALWPQVMAFVISFMVIGIAWITHHRMFRYIKRYDYRMVLLNLVFLLFVAFLPVPTALLGRYAPALGVVVFYAAVEGTSWLAELLLWLYASHHHRLLDPTLDPAIVRQMTARPVLAASIFLVSIPFAWIDPRITMGLWTVLAVVSLIFRGVIG